ncbi:hypothetical protein IGJ01_000950 [Enterococcus sp. AZ089]|uniref:LPXTG cell wall anchor domain-containing protein n=1 Tax=unclassified Enterococcus TaxID=2608891 RepID=UPI003D2FFF90
MKKSICILLLGFLLFFVASFESALASEKNQEVPVVYTVSITEKHKLSVSVSGPGMVVDGSQTIASGTMIYELPVGQEKVLLAVPEKNAEIDSITWRTKQGTTINNLQTFDSRNGTEIKLKGLAEDTFLEVHFKESNEKNEGDVSNSPSSSDKTFPKTGGLKSDTLVQMGLLILLGCIIMYWKKIKKLLMND